jgi:hypothetical protein
MGLVPQARDVPRYAPLPEGVPELQTDDPVWVITTSGRLRLPLDPNVEIDPTCVVVDGVGLWFQTGAVVQPDGSLRTARPLAKPPDLTLPPLAP